MKEPPGLVSRETHLLAYTVSFAVSSGGLSSERVRENVSDISSGFCSSSPTVSPPLHLPHRSYWSRDPF